MTLKHCSIGWKFAFVAGIPIFGMVLLVAGSLWMAQSIQQEVVMPQLEQMQLDDVERELKALVDGKAMLLAEAIKDCETDAEKRAKLIELTDPDRWYDDKSGYFFVLDSDNIAVNVPPKTGEAKSGMDYSEVADVDGVRFVAELNKVAQNGGGFVRYRFTKMSDGVETTAPKLSYAVLIPGTEFCVGTGRYIDDMQVQLAAVDQRVTSAIRKYIVLFAICAGVVFMVSLMAAIAVGRNITQRLFRGKAFAEALRAGDLSSRLKMTDGDEIGQLAHALDEAAESLEAKAQLARRIAKGDLTGDVPIASDQDVLGHSLAHMVADLNATIRDIRLASTDVSQSARELASTSQILSESTTEQGSSLQEIRERLLELDEQTNSNAENSKQVQKLAGATADAGRAGDAQMGTVVHAMHRITGAADQIRNIIRTIDDIAFQTNLLALNAAVEAARAGQHGKGFAVVAEEVRNLAARSAKASRETADLINDAVSEIGSGNETAQQAAGVLKEISQSSSDVVDLANKVAAATAIQSQNVSDVNRGLENIDVVTQSNTSAAEETAAAATEMDHQATALKQLVERFTVRTE